MDESTKLLLNKLAAAVAITVSGIVGAVVPVVVTKTRFSAILICFEAAAAGTLFGLAVFHLFLESAVVLEHFDFGYYVGGTWHNPTQAFVFLGFALVFLLEYIIPIPGMSHDHHVDELSPKDIEDTDGASTLVVVDPEHKDRNVKESSFSTLSGADKEAIVNAAVDNAMVAVTAPNAVRGHSGTFVKLDESDPSIDRSVAVVQPKARATSTRSLSSLVALAMHSIFEGVLVGLASTISGVWVIALGIIGHKWAEAFALSCQYIAEGMTRRSIFYHQLVFCGMQPIVVFIGIALHKSNEIVAGIFDGLACGTIFYVSTSTIFASFILHKPTKGVWQSRYGARFVSFCLGSIFMAAVSLIP